MTLTTWTRQLGSLNRSRRSTRPYKNSWKRAKPSTRLGMTSIRWSIVFKLETSSGCISVRIGCKGEGEKLKPIRYGPFRILEKIGENAFRLDLPAYMHIYSVVNANFLRLILKSKVNYFLLMTCYLNILMNCRKT